MTIDRQDAMDRQLLESELEKRGQAVRGNSCTCPWHEDRNASASIISDATGHWRVYCHGCDKHGDVYDLREQIPGKVEAKPRAAPKTTLQLADKADVKQHAENMGTVEDWYVYGQPPVLIIARIHPRFGKNKIFIPYTPKDGGYVVSKDGQKNVPLYRQEELTHVDRVLVVEGEKCVNAARACGIFATTSVGGAKNAAGSDWSALAGKQVVLWPDYDDNGAAYMDEVSIILASLGCSISRIDPAGIGIEKKGDIADLVAMWPERTQRETDLILALMDDAESQGAMADMQQWHEKIYSGKWRSLPWPLQKLGELSRASIPCSVTLLCADPGAGKSWMILHLMWFWHTMGVKSCARLFEDSAYVHMARLLALMTGKGGHTDDAWIRENRPMVEQHLAQHGKELQVLGSRIVAETDDLWTADQLVAWAETSAKAGNRVLMIDPITALKQGKEPWLQDFELAMRLKIVAKKYECSIIITTHPRGSAKEPSLSMMSGGVAWPRFSHTVLWLEMHRDPKEVRLWSGEATAVNRSMHILKCRHGKGAGVTVGLNFGDDIRFSEVGALAPEQKDRKPWQAKPKAPPARVSPDNRFSKDPSNEEDLFA